MKFDIRNLPAEEIDEIVFAEDRGNKGQSQASHLIPNFTFGNLLIEDTCESLLISSIEHWNNLKSAMDTAIALGWIK